NNLISSYLLIKTSLIFLAAAQLFLFVYLFSMCLFHVVKETKNWTEAQRYCRENYTDLAIVRNEDENTNISSLVRPANTFVWIGLFRVFWKWSDGSTMSFTNWQQKPDGRQKETCVVTSSNGKWLVRPCSERKSFVCYGAGEFRSF
uniref:C-type lectin domain-containing protein n=1 Tax=Myripristis murdjan TaxID=586833 RepID=A0A668APQ5_9TELE